MAGRRSGVIKDSPGKRGQGPDLRLLEGHDQAAAVRWSLRPRRHLQHLRLPGRGNWKGGRQVPAEILYSYG